MTDNNTCIFIGRIVKDTVLEEKNNKTYARFTVALNHEFKNEKGEKQSSVSFINLIIWDAQAKAIQPYLLKGRQVSVIGHLKENKWTDESGNHSKLDVIVDKLQLLGNKNISENNGAGNNSDSVTAEAEVDTYDNNSPYNEEMNGFF